MSSLRREHLSISDYCNASATLNSAIPCKRTQEGGNLCATLLCCSLNVLDRTSVQYSFHMITFFKICIYGMQDITV